MSVATNFPTEPGYYWAKWRIATEGTLEGDELTPSSLWEIVQVNDNNGEEGTLEELSVAVSGIRETQWRDGFFWGPKVADLHPRHPTAGDHTVWPVDAGAKELRRLRQVRGLSLRDLAKEVGVGHATLSRVEQGQTPDMETARKLLYHMGLCPCCGRSAIAQQGTITPSADDSVAS